MKRILQLGGLLAVAALAVGVISLSFVTAPISAQGAATGNNTTGSNSTTGNSTSAGSTGSSAGAGGASGASSPPPASTPGY